MTASIRITLSGGENQSERSVELVFEQDGRLDITAKVRHGGDVRLNVIPVTGESCGGEGKANHAVEDSERGGVLKIDNRSAGRVGNFAVGAGVCTGHNTYLTRLVEVQNSQASNNLKPESSGGN